jgi:hypothetical protein
MRGRKMVGVAFSINFFTLHVYHHLELVRVDLAADGPALGRMYYSSLHRMGRLIPTSGK